MSKSRCGDDDDDKVIDERCVGKNLEGSDVKIIPVLSQNFPGRTQRRT
jgi:hypothetical protein